MPDFFAELTPGLKDEVNRVLLNNENIRHAEAEVTADVAEPQLDPINSHFTMGNKHPKRDWKLFSGDAWRLNVDGAANVHGSGAGIVLVSPNSTLHESVISINFSATNNEAKYESLIAGLTLALRLGPDSVHVLCDSQLVVSHFNDDYRAKDNRMNAYVSYVLSLFRRLGRVKVEWIPREHNAHADALAGLASVFRTSGT